MSTTSPRAKNGARNDLTTLARVIPFLWQGEGWGARLRIVACVGLTFLSSFAAAFVPLGSVDIYLSHRTMAARVTTAR
jgi:hypothetical protein